MGGFRRRPAGAALAAIIATSALVVATPAEACACGAFLLPEDEGVSVSSETAVIAWDGQQERIILSLDVESPTDDAALLLPTPSPAAVEIADGAMFREVAAFTAPRVREVDLWWPEWLVSEDLSNEGVSFSKETPPPAAPVDEIDVAVIDAADADALEEWLSKNGFVMRDDVAGAIVPYIQQGWHFVLIKLHADSLTGRLQPLDIRFDTNQVVYPMRLGVAGGPVHVSTYLFAEHRMERTDSMGGNLTWAGPVTQTDFTNQTLVELANAHPFLTAWEQNFPDPRNQLDGDMVFAAASEDTPFAQVYTEVIRHEIWGTPAGPTLIFGGLIIIGFGGGLISMVRRRRGQP